MAAHCKLDVLFCYLALVFYEAHLIGCSLAVSQIIWLSFSAAWQ